MKNKLKNLRIFIYLIKHKSFKKKKNLNTNLRVRVISKLNFIVNLIFYAYFFKFTLENP